MNKAKKNSLQAIILIILIVAIVFGAAIGQAQVSNPVNQEIISIYKKALELNEGRFADPNLIYIGDTVLFPGKSGGIEAWIANEPSDGKHDSFWRLSEKYVAGQLTTVPAEVIKITVTTPAPQKEDLEKESGMSWQEWIMLIALALVGTLMFYMFRENFKRPGNPDYFQPVGGNIDAMPREEVLTSVMRRFLLPGEHLISFRRGTLANSLRKRRFSVNMEFRDNVNQQVWLNAGERVSTAIIEDANGNRRTQHLRNACSNGFGSDSFSLPNGWFIQYDESEESGRVFTESDGQGGQHVAVGSRSETSSNAGLENFRRAAESFPEPKNLQTGLESLIKIIQELNLDKENSVAISFKDNRNEIDLSVNVAIADKNAAK